VTVANHGDPMLISSISIYLDPVNVSQASKQGSALTRTPALIMAYE
jgi:hypothetical protein